MAKQDSSVSYGGGGIGCLTALGLIFIALKLAGVGQVANWSWWWVLAPFWIQIPLVLIVLLFVFIVAVIVSRR